MAIDCLIRVSFQSETEANQEVSLALVGDRQAAVGPKPFQRVNTAVYRVVAGQDADVISALNDLATTLNDWASSVDYVNISLTRRRAVFNIAFTDDITTAVAGRLLDIAQVERAVAQSAIDRGDKMGEWDLSVGGLAMQCTQELSGASRKLNVRLKATGEE